MTRIRLSDARDPVRAWTDLVIAANVVGAALIVIGRWLRRG